MRGLAKRETNIDIEEYVWGFVRSCFESFEISYWLDDELICLAVCDAGKNSLSAVYTFFEPELKSDSVGTYSILKQIEYCQQRELQYLYLGYFVAESPHMKYKSRFVPNERLIDGRWQRFTQDS
jgi:arginine-tRNA-protein transferase